MKTRLLLFFILLSAMLSQSCTILGLTIGGIADISNSKKDRVISIEELKNLKTGTNVKIITDSGKTYRGLYDSFESRMNEEHKNDTLFRIRRVNTITKISTNEIEEVIQEKAKGLTFIGAGIGFLVDLIIYTIINNN